MKTKTASKVMRKPTRRTLRDVKPADLTDRDRLEALHKRAVASGVIDSGEYTRLNFFAAAAQARLKGTDPAALFAWLVNGQRWDLLTDASDDAARRMLKPRRAPRPERREGEPQPEPVPMRDVMAGVLRKLVGGPA